MIFARRILAAVIGGGLVIGLASCKGPQTAHVDPALNTLVPPDTTLMVGIRVENLVKLPLYQKTLANRPIPQLDEFAKRTGVNARTDIWELLLVSDGKETAVLGRGKFWTDFEPRLPQTVLPEGATRTTYKTLTLTGNDKNTLVFLSGTVAMMGDTPFIKRIIDSRDQTNGPPVVLAERLKDIPPQAAIWSVFNGSPISAPKQAFGPKGNTTIDLSKIIGLIQSGSFYLDLQPGGNGKASLLSMNDDEAKKLGDALRGMLGLARMMAGGVDPTGGKAGKTSPVGPQMQKMIESLRVTQEASRTNVYIDQPEPIVEQLLGMLPGSQGKQ